MLLDTQGVNATIQAEDAEGNPVTATGSDVPSWSSSAPSIVSVTPAADGMSAAIKAVGPLGSAQISVSAFGLSGSINVQVNASAATQIAIVLGTPSLN